MEKKSQKIVKTGDLQAISTGPSFQLTPSTYCQCSGEQKTIGNFILGYVLFHLFEGLDFLCLFVVVGWICTFWMIGGVSSAAKFILCFKLCHRGIITLVRGRAAADEFE